MCENWIETNWYSQIRVKNNSCYSTLLVCVIMNSCSLMCFCFEFQYAELSWSFFAISGNVRISVWKYNHLDELKRMNFATKQNLLRQFPNKKKLVQTAKDRVHSSYKWIASNIHKWKTPLRFSISFALICMHWIHF